MGAFLRNPEIKKHLLVSILCTIMAAICGYFIDARAMLLILVLGIVLILLSLLSTKRRYDDLNRLSQDIDLMLHQGKAMDFSSYGEGELSILESELQKMTLRLTEQAKNLEHDKIYLADSMADISHQLRTPLTSSQLIITLLRSPDLDERRRRRLLAELAGHLEHMGWLVESLLKMAKMDANTAYFQSENVRVEELIVKSSEALLVPLELRGIQLLVDVEEDCSYVGDMDWTVEAVANILKNCMEHIHLEDESSANAIEVTGQQNALYTQIVIQDTGEGFSEEDLPHIFERFYKGSNSGSGSVGIGLALARMIIANQNGTIKASDREDGKSGARFEIRFYHQNAI